MAYYDPKKPVTYAPADAPAGVGIPRSILGRGLSRRRLLQAMAAAGGAAALATNAGAAAAAGKKPQGLTGTIKDIKHVVILMQENRSFDHYYGTLAGVRGFGDQQVLRYQDGTDVFHQPDPKRTDGGYLLPFRLETGKYNAQNAGGLDHEWGSSHNAWAKGKLNGWVAAKGEQTMGYFTGDDVPWQHALASAYTIADHNHCALAGGTSPNRIYMWSGGNDPNGIDLGPAIDNGGDYLYGYTWQTYPEVLQEAGVSWQIYVNNNTDNNWFGDYTDNTLRSFAAFDPAKADDENSKPGQGLLARANVLETHTTPPSDVPNSSANLEYVLKQFIDDCGSGTIPEVSWIVAPYLWSEHPSGAPDWGAVYQARVIKALHDNPDLWNSTLLISTFDENDGYFDHVHAPLPEPGTEGEFIYGLPIGPGARVPMILVSPWTRGGYVASEVFDHTSIIQFLEKWTTAQGKPAISTNITEWRRTVCGDLTSAIDFTSYDNSLPDLPDSAVLGAAAVADAGLPSITNAIPAPGSQAMPDQETGNPLKPRPVPYQQHARLEVDRSTGVVTTELTNTGAGGVSHQVFPDRYRAFEGTPFTVTKDAPRTYTWDTTDTEGKYAFSVYGPDRFVRSFAGTVVPSGQNVGQVPTVDAQLSTRTRRTLTLTLGNDGHKAIRYTLTPNDFDGTTQTVNVDGGRSKVINWPTNAYGYYDVTISSDTNDGFSQRYAGRIS